jgi:glucosamine-6-phosphate deaminase
MDVIIHPEPAALGRAAGNECGDLLVEALTRQERVRLVVATGASQFATLATLVERRDIAWRRIDCFHLDEYVGVADSHPASFRRYLHERFVSRMPDLGSFHGVQGDVGDPRQECARLGALITAAPIDVLLLGIGENAHLAFNDPPADCITTAPYLVVDLDERCRQQQVGEGWFPDLAAVPTQAISMSVQHMLSAHTIVGSVPDARKAAAVRDSLEGPPSPQVPASYLRQHPRCRLHLDTAAASLLAPGTVARAHQATA